MEYLNAETMLETARAERERREADHLRMCLKDVSTAVIEGQARGLAVVEFRFDGLTIEARSEDWVTHVRGPNYIQQALNLMEQGGLRVTERPRNLWERLTGTGHGWQIHLSQAGR